ncbi:hypothetical protein ACLOJK_006081 [Asimina triloba]
MDSLGSDQFEEFQPESITRPSCDWNNIGYGASRQRPANQTMVTVAPMHAEKKRAKLQTSRILPTVIGRSRPSKQRPRHRDGRYCGDKRQEKHGIRSRHMAVTKMTKLPQGRFGK